ncbi:helix-turn-helix transcriptional regulator [Paenibacillus sp. L3-i20]|uniref:helix-turn-helix domain-containing protein n=1 Tax=Paenibacillus sp. L3-i20 TaxID=2905833 RepID=UPI001EE10606|nr:helix-turn-helix transcriptional regulator [Paenibacillus sp. L3-i20]GKU76864.1 hypothetical protein L3i20_v212610 [Paenibacillus sp. L3-i20]
MYVPWDMWIKANRKHRGLTQHDLAYELGASQRAVINWENGITTPKKMYQERINGLFGDYPR